MKGVVFTGSRRVEVREFPDPVPGPGEVVVRVMASGMCGSDLHALRSPEPAADSGELIIQGHEPAGIVHEVGPGPARDAVAVGDHVMIHHYWGCTRCVECRSGWPQLCQQMPARISSVNEHGAHAELIKVPAAQTMPLPQELSFRTGAAIGCGFGTAFGAIERAGGVSGKKVLVLGQGPVGLSVTILAASLGAARIIVTDIADKRLALAGRLGAHDLVDASRMDTVEVVRDLSNGRGVDVVMETSGNSAAAAQGLELLAPWGTMCAVGVGADIGFNTRDTLRRPLTLITSWTLSTTQQIRCADLVAERGLPVDDLFSHGWSLNDAAEAYEWFDKQTGGKGVLES